MCLELDFKSDLFLCYVSITESYQFTGNESPSFAGSPAFSGGQQELPNEISAPYEVPQFPIEQIEKKLAIQRQINYK